MAGYNEMMRRIEPAKIICYNTPFPEMQGNIIYVDYERSSWRYMNYERSFQKEDLDAFKIGGTYCAECDIIAPFLIGGTRKGGGSAYGGEAKPAKPADERFWGVPGEIKTTSPHGYRIDTKIGPDGRAERERHYTDHHRPDKHSVPHDHIINWETPHRGQLNFEKPHINYWPSEYPDGAPEFKSYRGKFMNDSLNSEDDNRFKTISDFKNCIIRGGEVVFLWNGVDYAISSDAEKISISEGYKPETEKLYDTPDDVLEYKVGNDRLRDVITQVTVLDRTI